MTKVKLLVSFLGFGVVAAPVSLRAADQTNTNTQNTQSPASLGAEGSQIANPPSASTSQADAEKVLTDLHHANLMEIQMGQLAKKSGHLQAVKDFGDKLVKDHQDADTKVTTLAKSQNIQLADAQMSNSAAMTKLQSLKGAAFDAAFAKQMVDDHQKSIDMLQSAQIKISGTPTGDLVAQILPVIQAHERIATDLVTQINAAQKQKS